MELILLCLNLTVTAALFAVVLLRKPEAAKEKPEQLTEKRRENPDPIDEGFENIMRYEVNGQTGFEPEYHVD